MLSISGYSIQEIIYEGTSTVVYRGIRDLDLRSVILKTIKTDYPTATDIAKLKHEYELTKKLDLPEIIKPYALETYNNNPVLILEDFGGETLANPIKSNNFNLESFLKIAIQLTLALEYLHQNNVIHKDIKPQNIIINAKTQQIKIIDFSISSLLSKENQTINNPNLLEGTLAYISPEQTGRMNRSIDYRTDFYSLGVTFYEMLTGKLPFKATDPMELVHCHIAKQPIAPHNLNSTIPITVSDLVIKLLSKTAEERYQSAYGIKADLETCLTQLLETGNIEKFILAQKDLSGQFEIPQKLYGRELEVTTLLEAFERVSEGTTEMMLVAGYSGIGKSALVNEIHKPIVRKRGYFISGKFDQYKRNIPYSSIIQAFRDLMQQLLTESSEQIQSWKQKLLDALGPNGQVIIDVIPEVELIIGQQPVVVQLAGTESQNRFNLVFKNFIHVFTQKNHPLVLFLDDLQWADSASLKLIQLLVTDSDGQYLLMIGAYRDNEVSPTHPFILTLDEIQKVGATVNAIALQPLAIADINQLIVNTLNCTLERSQPLAELILQKTAGNPFFLTQLLKYLYQEGFLVFNFNNRAWQWNIEQIYGMGATDNVVELMVSKIQKLSHNTENILKLAACIGNRFDLNLLSIVNEKSLSATAADLWEALQSNLILPLSNAYKVPRVLEQFDELVVDYKFLHDRVQQAAYALIPEDHKKEVHLKIGQLLLQNSSPGEREENVFDIVNQLNIGTELIVSQLDKHELAQLNLIAGQKAKAATAYEAALRYLTFGLELLGTDSWHAQYELTLTLYVETVEVEYLCTNFERAEMLSEIVLQQATTLLERMKVYELKIQFYIAENQMLKAIDTALPVLELLGFPVSQTPDAMSLVAELPGLADLENIPEMTDPYQLAALRLLTIITGPAYMGKPEILPLIVFKMINICLEYGHSALAAYAYGMYGLLLCGPLGDIETGYHSGRVSLQLLEQFQAKELKCKIYMLFNTFIRHWKEHYRETIPSFVEATQSGFETGDIVYATYCCMWSCGYLFLTGEPLSYIEQKQGQYADLLLKLKQDYGFYPARTWRQLSLNLQDSAVNKYQLIGNSFSEADMQHLHVANNRMLLFFAYFAKLILAYLFKDYATAVANAKIAAEYESAATASMLLGAYNFYDSLARLSLYPTVEPNEQQQYLQRVEENQQKMHEWANRAPCNYKCKYELVEAEKLRVLGQTLEAMEYYDRAIESARENSYIQEVALAAERAADFYLFFGREKIAQIYLTESHYNYDRWGANAKVRELETQYPQLVYKTSTERNTRLKSVATISTSTTDSDVGVLDLATVMKASQAIASEIVLDKLLSKLMKLAIENAGAQKGFLILSNNGELRIEASGEVDNEVTVLQSIPVDSSHYLPIAIVNYVARTQENVVLSDATDEGIFTTDSYVIKNQVKSVLCAPILNQGKLIGIIYLENNLTAGAFTPARLEVLKILSSQTAISIENALLYQTLEQKVEERTTELAQANQEITVLNKRLKAENLRMSAELEVTRQLQQMILPKESELESIENLDIAGFMQPADEVGGDYYDVLNHDGRVKIGIGDVTGHGLESGVLMIMAQTAVRTLLTNNETDPVKFLSALNRTIYDNVQRMNSDKNMTLSLLDYQDGTLQLSGQHEEVIVVRSSGEVERIDTIDLGFPIGLEADIADFVAETRVQLNSGDVVVLYTDGITEAEDINGVQYGLDRLCDAVSRNREAIAAQIKQAVIDDLRSHIGEQKVYDDITLLVLKQK